MDLYTSLTTPFGRKVMVMLIELGLQDRVRVMPVAGSPLDPGTMPVSRNPLGKIPALVTDDGATLFDSRVICRYLDDMSGVGLYPKGLALWPVLTLEATADGILEAALLVVYEQRLRPEEMRFTPWVEGQWAKIARALDAVEAQSLRLLGGTPTAAHFAMACALGYLDFRHSARDWRQNRPGLGAWEKAIAARPSLISTRPI
jgi:glutathione S-transferase